MKKIQKKIKKFCQKNYMNLSIEYGFLDIISELGEAAKEILKMSDYGKKPIKYKKELKSELGDVFYSLIVIANAFDIDLEDALYKTLDKYKKRLKKGSAGSESY